MKRVQNYIFSVWKLVAEKYGFDEIAGPLLEPMDLYKKSGQEVPAQMYSFVDKSGYVGDPIPDEHTHTISSQGSGTAHSHGTSYRPYAAVGTLQYQKV